MTAPRIQLAGCGKSLTGLTWESDRGLRIGRHQNLDVVLQEHTVARFHAEIKYQGLRWVLRDLASNPVYPTLVNQKPLLVRDHELKLQDTIQIGSAQLRVVVLTRESLQEVVQTVALVKNLAILKKTSPSIARRSVETDMSQLVEQQQALVTRTVTSVARAAEMRDDYSSDHPKRVTEYSLLLADVLRVSALEKHHLQLGAPLHDIGKMSLENSILRKPGKLTPGEFEHIKSHTVQGARMLDAIAHLLPMIPIVRHHHEQWDGNGYPDGLKHEQIPLIARIVSIADTFDAMTSRRPYRPALPAEQAFLELIRKAGTHFDPACVYAFMRLRPEIEAMIQGS